MKKNFLLIFIPLFTCLVLVLSFLLFWKDLKQTDLSLPPPQKIEELPPSQRIVEIETQADKLKIFEQTFGHTPPPVYEERMKIFSIAPEKKSGFIKELIIFSYPLLPTETLNISVWTGSIQGKPIKEVKGMVQFQSKRIAEIDFLPIKTIIQGGQTQKLWMGIKEPIKDQELFVSGKKYLITLEAFDYFDIIIDKLPFELEIEIF